MKKYIALLRGINIGGKNKIAMPLLRQAFEELGFTEVVTYINSGNVVFSSECQDKNELIEQCEAVIAAEFALTIPVNIVSADELAETLSHAPNWWDDDKESIHYAHHDRVIFWSASAKTFSKSRWSKIASSSVNNRVTIRNANTANKLLQLSK